MIQIKIKRVYDDPEPGDGYRVLVDRLWPRGIKKACLSYDEWAKEITPSPGLRTWFHDDISRHWEEFTSMYKEELEHSQAVKDFLSRIGTYPVVTLLYASKDPVHNHARILQNYLETQLKNNRITHSLPDGYALLHAAGCSTKNPGIIYPTIRSDSKSSASLFALYSASNIHIFHGNSYLL